MELITYRKTLDVHKNGVQFMLQGFETADNMSRVIELSLMASGDAVDFPLERIVATMYVTTPSAKEPSINECTIKDNKVVYNVLPIVEEGITTMQLKLIETSPDGAKRVLASPKFTVEVTNSNTNDDGEELKTTFTAIEDFIAKADAAYGSRLERIELTSECIFKAYYYDGTTYETDVLRKLFLNGNVELSKSYAVGGTGVRTGEDTDNSKYYSNVSKSESLNAKAIMEDSEKILEEVRLHGMYTAFQVDFTTGNVEYVSPSFKFNINSETGELDAIGQTYTFEEEIERLVLEWLEANKINIADLQNYSERLAELKDTSEEHTERIETLEERITPIELGGTGATTKDEAIKNLGIDEYQKPWKVDENLVCINVNSASLSVEHKASDDTPPPKDEITIFMKNSGQICLSYIFKQNKYNPGPTDNPPPAQYCFGGIYKNNEIVKSYGVDFYEKYTKEDWFNGTYSEDSISFGDDNSNSKTFNEKIIVDVNKGDIIRFYVSSMFNGEGGVAGQYIKASFSNINLYANTETPYTYFNLTDTMPEKITATDILNALTGGNE